MSDIPQRRTTKDKFFIRVLPRGASKPPAEDVPLITLTVDEGKRNPFLVDVKGVLPSFDNPFLSRRRVVAPHSFMDPIPSQHALEENKLVEAVEEMHLEEKKTVSILQVKRRYRRNHKASPDVP